METASNHDEVELLFQDWLWWIFKYLPFPHVVSTQAVNAIVP